MEFRTSGKIQGHFEEHSKDQRDMWVSQKLKRSTEKKKHEHKKAKGNLFCSNCYIGGGLALPLAIDILRRLFEVVK